MSYEEEDQAAQLLAELLALPENGLCCDCSAPGVSRRLTALCCFYLVHWIVATSEQIFIVSGSHFVFFPPCCSPTPHRSQVGIVDNR